MSLVPSVHNIKTEYPNVWQFAAEAHPFFCSVGVTVVRWVPQHLLMLQLADKNFNPLSLVVSVSSSVVCRLRYLAVNSGQ